MPDALEYVQDGAPLSDRFDGGATRLPDPDAVQEVRLKLPTPALSSPPQAPASSQPNQARTDLSDWRSQMRARPILVDDPLSDCGVLL